MSEDKEDEAEKFRRAATARSVVKAIRELGDCANEKEYESTPDDVEMLIKEIYKELDAMSNRFGSYAAEDAAGPGRQGK